MAPKLANLTLFFAEEIVVQRSYTLRDASFIYDFSNGAINYISDTKFPSNKFEKLLYIRLCEFVLSDIKKYLKRRNFKSAFDIAHSFLKASFLT
jgi:hypothetical protein